MTANNKLGKLWNKAVIVYFKVLQCLTNCGELKKTIKRKPVRIAGIWVEN
jgi:hypothetical protein